MSDASDLHRATGVAIGKAIRTEVETIARNIATEAARDALAGFADVEAIVTKAAGDAARDALQAQARAIAAAARAETDFAMRRMDAIDAAIADIRKSFEALDAGRAEEIWQQTASEMERLSKERAHVVVERKAFWSDTEAVRKASETAMQTAAHIRSLIADLEKSVELDVAATVAAEIEKRLAGIEHRAAEVVSKALGALQPGAIVPRAFLGPYRPEAEYAAGDLATWRGSTWIRTAPGAGEAPVAKAGGPWQLFAAGGYGGRKTGAETEGD